MSDCPNHCLVISLSLHRSASGMPNDSNYTLGAFKMIGTGPLVNMKGEKVGGIYPALKVCYI